MRGKEALLRLSRRKEASSNLWRGKEGLSRLSRGKEGDLTRERNEAPAKRKTVEPHGTGRNYKAVLRERAFPGCLFPAVYRLIQFPWDMDVPAPNPPHVQ